MTNKTEPIWITKICDLMEKIEKEKLRCAEGLDGNQKEVNKYV